MDRGSEKVAISQRWERDFLDEVKHVAGKFGTSMTQLTKEALKLYLSLVDVQQFVNTPNDKRRTELETVARLHFTQKEGKSSYNINISEIKELGFIREQVEHLLKYQPEKKFSTNEISELLDIPQSTARTYVRDLSDENDQFKLIKGRPNKIYFSPTPL